MSSNRGILKTELLDTITNGFNEMRKEKILTDVVLECENKHLHAHKVVLRAGCPYLKGMFSTNPDVKAATKIVLPSAIKLDALEFLLEYLYTGNIGPIEYDIDLVKTVLIASHVLQLASVNKYCWHLLCKQLSVTSFIFLWNTAAQYGNDEIAEFVCSFLAANFKKVSNAPEFLELDNHQMKKLIGSPSLSCHADDVVHGILSWVKHNQDERQSELERLLSYVSLHDLSGDCLINLQSEELIMRSVNLLKLLLSVATAQMANPVSELQVMCFGRGDNISCVSIYEHKFRKWTTEKTLPFILTNGMSIVFYDNHVYFFGGGDTSRNANKAILKYNHRSNTAIAVSNFDVAKVNVGTVVLDRKIYCVGGLLKKGSKVKDVLRFEPDNEYSWHSLAQTNHGHNFPRLVTILDHLFVVGSVDCSTVERYDIHANQWTVVSSVPYPVTLEWPRITVCQHKIYIIVNTHAKNFIIYDAICDSWQTSAINSEVDRIYGIWSLCYENKQIPFMFLSDGERSLHKFDPKTHTLERLTRNTDHAWNWWHTLVVY